MVVVAVVSVLLRGHRVFAMVLLLLVCRVLGMAKNTVVVVNVVVIVLLAAHRIFTTPKTR
jgi:hypothetical protein